MSYSPKIKSELVRKLYLLKHSLPKKKPMTRLVNEAIEKYLLERKDNDGKREGSI
jgi:hypothetical protein